jgi:protein phosphatase 2C family protein 2/3
MNRLLGIYDKPKVNPGGLTITRSIGDFPSKLTKLGGIPNVIISTPDLLAFYTLNEMDFIILGTGAIYERLSNNHIAYLVFQALYDAIENKLPLDLLYTNSLQNIFKEAIEKGVKDTLSCIIIFFESFLSLYETRNIEFVRYKLKFLSERIHLQQSERYYNYIRKIFVDDDPNVNRLERSVIINNNINNNNNNNINIIKETKFYCCGIFGGSTTKTNQQN